MVTKRSTWTWTCSDEGSFELQTAASSDDESSVGERDESHVNNPWVEQSVEPQFTGIERVYFRDPAAIHVGTNLFWKDPDDSDDLEEGEESSKSSHEDLFRAQRHSSEASSFERDRRPPTKPPPHRRSFRSESSYSTTRSVGAQKAKSKPSSRGYSRRPPPTNRRPRTQDEYDTSGDERSPLYGKTLRNHAPDSAPLILPPDEDSSLGCSPVEAVVLGDIPPRMSLIKTRQKPPSTLGQAIAYHLMLPENDQADDIQTASILLNEIPMFEGKMFAFPLNVLKIALVPQNCPHDFYQDLRKELQRMDFIIRSAEYHPDHLPTVLTVTTCAYLEILRQVTNRPPVVADPDWIPATVCSTEATLSSDLYRPLTEFGQPDSTNRSSTFFRARMEARLDDTEIMDRLACHGHNIVVRLNMDGQQLDCPGCVQGFQRDDDRESFILNTVVLLPEKTQVAPLSAPLLGYSLQRAGADERSSNKSRIRPDDRCQLGILQDNSASTTRTLLYCASVMSTLQGLVKQSKFHTDSKFLKNITNVLLTLLPPPFLPLLVGFYPAPRVVTDLKLRKGSLTDWLQKSWPALLEAAASEVLGVADVPMKLPLTLNGLVHTSDLLAECQKSKKTAWADLGSRKSPMTVSDDQTPHPATHISVKSPTDLLSRICMILLKDSERSWTTSLTANVQKVLEPICPSLASTKVRIPRAPVTFVDFQADVDPRIGVITMIMLAYSSVHSELALSTVERHRNTLSIFCKVLNKSLFADPLGERMEKSLEDRRAKHSMRAFRNWPTTKLVSLSPPCLLRSMTIGGMVLASRSQPEGRLSGPWIPPGMNPSVLPLQIAPLFEWWRDAVSLEDFFIPETRSKIFLGAAKAAADVIETANTNAWDTNIKAAIQIQLPRFQGRYKLDCSADCVFVSVWWLLFFMRKFGPYQSKRNLSSTQLEAATQSISLLTRKVASSVSTIIQMDASTSHSYISELVSAFISLIEPLRFCQNLTIEDVSMAIMNKAVIILSSPCSSQEQMQHLRQKANIAVLAFEDASSFKRPDILASVAGRPTLKRGVFLGNFPDAGKVGEAVRKVSTCISGQVQGSEGNRAAYETSHQSSLWSKMTYDRDLPPDMLWNYVSLPPVPTPVDDGSEPPPHMGEMTFCRCCFSELRKPNVNIEHAGQVRCGLAEP